MSINEVLNTIQKSLSVPKGRKNTFGNYNYRSCEDIVEGVKKILPVGYSLTLNDDIVMLGDRFYVKATASLSGNDAVVSSCGWAREALDKKGMDVAQITGAASSYARKYALNGLFAIDDTQDVDSDEHKKERDAAAERARVEAQNQKRKKAEEWVNGYLLKLEALDLSESSHDLVNLQTDNVAMLKRIETGYPNLHKVIATTTDKVRGAQA
jgi:hypothetical protein